MISLGFHEMKQYVAFTNELFKYIQSGKNDAIKEQIFLKDYRHLNIGVESMMSIINIKNYESFENKKEVTKKNNAVELNEIVNSCVESYKKKGVKFEYIQNHKCLLLIRKDVLYAIVGNLIKNAFFFSNRLVWVTTEEKENSLAISVANTGKKIPKKKRKEILKPGIALNGQSGLGLHICNLWCEKINAQILLESTSVATEFKIVFPKKLILKEPNVLCATEDIPNFSEVKSDVQIIKKSIDLAVIDDIETFRIGLKSELTELGFNVLTFEDIDMFLDSIQEGKVNFDCVIVDRHGKGFDAAKDRFPESCKYYNFKGKIILYSSNVEEHQLEYYKSLGFDSTVSKSVSVDWKNEIHSILKCGK
ncbi:MAG: ATP-binding protein [Oligoflexales bacterium]